MESKYSLGILGLGVMGRSLAQNFARNAYPPIGYDLAPHLPDDFDVKVVKSLDELVAVLTPPRMLFLMVPAGAPVDAAIASLKPNLHEGDLIIDGGNSYFADTERRVKDLATGGFQFIGMGVSGGESGALWGPSMMPGGIAAGLAAGQDDVRDHRSQSRGRRALRSLDGFRRGWTLCQNGSQWHRVWRYAADR